MLSLFPILLPRFVVDHSTLQRWVQRFEKLISGVECANARNWWKAASGWMRPNIKLKGK